jgi:hypothetical protein
MIGPDMVRVRFSDPSLAGVLRPRKPNRCDFGRLSTSFEILAASDIAGEPPGEESAVSNEDATDNRFEAPCVCLYNS